MFCPLWVCVSILGSRFCRWPAAPSPAGPLVWPPLLLSYLFIWVPSTDCLGLFPLLCRCCLAKSPQAASSWESSHGC